MKLDKLVGDRFKERPSDCQIDSHAIMVRGGYIKYMANGIFSSYTPTKRITKKIEQIIREEMDKIDGQEVQFPVVMPASLWQESGRYESIGSELLRFTDRNRMPMVLGMTHEEAAVHLVREYGKSYTKYPFMIYQIQTKFRDEARPRGGLIRVREFTMKDAYSFHTSQEDLEQYYDKCHKAYENIFRRAGVPEVISVKSDSGMMGGSISHEFMLLTPVGEDTIASCHECGFNANMEAADSIIENTRDEVSAPMELVHTPNIHTIEEICDFLHTPKEKSCKAVVYQRNADDSYVVVFTRGDIDVNETKLRNFLGCEIHPAVITEECGLNAPQVVSSANDYTQGFPAMFAVLDEMDNLEKSIMIHDEQELSFHASKYENYMIRPFLNGKMYEIDVFCNLDGSPVYITPRAKEEVEGKESARYRVVRDHKIVEEAKKVIRN